MTDRNDGPPSGRPEKRRLIDGRRPTTDWQTLQQPIAVLPIGAFEQHGTHLPLLTDTLLATHFGEHLAAELGAALLPTLPIGQSYEHTGFRGSLSLRPETIMAVVRDLVDELERQHFTRMILLNGHGGNFALPTVVRDINRLDRPIKVILVNWYDYIGDTLAADPAAVGDVHAGFVETSIMLAVHEELVGEPEAPEPSKLPEAVQGDLNHFGLAVLRPAGPWGDARPADIDKGRLAIADAKEGLVRAVRARLAWLDAHGRYGGEGPVALRPLTDADIPAALHLSNLAGWNQTADDWRMMLAASEGSNFAAVSYGKVVATATAARYEGKTAWIGMVLVDPAFRRRGIATRLLRAAVEAAGDCESIKLDATPAGKTVYDALGFVDEYELSRMTATALKPVAAPPDGSVRTMTDADLDAVVDLDAEVFGVRRKALIKGLFAADPAGARVAESDGAIRGFLLSRPGVTFRQIGPIGADDEAAAVLLAESALADLAGRAVVIDVPRSHGAFLARLEELGFAEQRPFIRMVQGPNAHPGRPSRQFAIAGPEWG